MIWVAIAVYSAIGAFLVGWLLGSSKISTGWSKDIAWKNFRLDFGFWIILSILWFPALILVFINGVVNAIVDKFSR